MKKPTDISARRNKFDEKQSFVQWVNSLALEKTRFGKLIYGLEQNFRIKRLMLVFLFSLALAFIINFDMDFVFRGYKVGDHALTNVASPITFEMPDEITTLLRKKEAIDRVLPVFVYDPKVFDETISRVYRGFRDFRRRIQLVRWERDENESLGQIKVFLEQKPEFEKIIGKEGIPENFFEWLVFNKFSPKIENAVIKALELMSEQQWTYSGEAIKKANFKTAMKRMDHPNSEMIYEATGVKDLQASDEFLRRYRKLLGNFNPSEMEKLLKIVQFLAPANFILDYDETRDRQTVASDSVTPSVISIKRGQNIIREGTEIQASQKIILDEIYRLKNDQRRDLVSLAMAILVVTIILVSFSFVRRFTFTKIKVSTKDLMTMGTVLTVLVATAKLFLFVSEAFDIRMRGIIPTVSYLYLIPAAAGPMLIGLLISYGEIVWIFNLVLSFVLALGVGDSSFSFMIFSAVGGIAGARGVFKCRKRNDIYMAGLRVGLVNAALVTSMTVVLTHELEGLMNLIVWNILFAFLGGIISALMTMMLIPFLETVFNYTTDVKLLELSNLNHPLLREMIVKAPGTYHHSLVVGSMVEAAAEEIQANPLLAKVSSYYHDIGKMEHANYFIENQKSGQNPHDHLTPNMSKTILVAHVKDGAELGEKYKLGQPIIDVIRQHHGTTLISFFYHRAKEAEDSDIDNVYEGEFRYPGPKPRFKEAALSMLADSIEAAARSLDEPTPVRLQAIVKNIIHGKFMDGQLEECNLTLRDLSIIEIAFVRILLGIYHQRIDYPTRKSGSGSAASAP